MHSIQECLQQTDAMTIEELLACSPTELEAMTDTQLLVFFNPYLQFTRPEQVVKQPTVKATKDFKRKSRTSQAADLLAMFDKKYGSLAGI